MIDWSSVSPPKPSTGSSGSIDWGNVASGKRTTATPPKKQAGPFAALAPVFSGAKRAVGTGVSKVFDLLNRPSEASLALLAGRGLPAAASAFVHSESPEQYAADTQNVERRFMGDAAYKQIFEPDQYTGPYKLPRGAAGFNQGLANFTTQSVTDPTSVIGGSGAMEHIARHVGPKGLVALSRGIANLSRKGGNSEHAAQGLGWLYDLLHFKGTVQRDLASRFGHKGVTYFSGLKAINNARLRRAQDLANTLVSQLKNITKGLKPEQVDQLYQAMHTGAESALPDEMQPRAKAFSDLTDTLAYLSGTRALRAQLEAHGFQLPEWAQRFDTQVRSLQRPSQYRKNYVPTSHNYDTALGLESRPGSMAEMDQRMVGESLDEARVPRSGPFRQLLDAAAPSDETATRTTEGLKATDANLKQRSEMARLLDPEMQTRVIEARLRTGAKAISARDAEREVSRLFGVGGFSRVPADAQEFFRETYSLPDGKSFWTGLAKGLIDVPKVGLFALPFRHMANIGSLSVLADPSIANITGTAGKFARLLAAGANPEKRAAALGKAAKYGVTGTPSVDRSPGWIGVIPGIGDLYKASSHVLWSFDDAAKATRFESLLKQYTQKGLKESEAAYKAADDVGAELVDYSNRSPLTKALAYIAPFATYRSKVPVSIARAVVRHPERVLAAGRMSPELVGDEQQAGGGKVGKSYLPLAEVLRGAENPAEFARSTMGYPINMALSAAGVHGDDYPNYFTYGKAPDLKYFVNASAGSFPFVQAGLNKAGFGEFANQGGLNDTLRSQTGFSLTKGPSLRELMAGAHVSQQRQIIANLRSHGNNAAANDLQKKLDQYLRFNRLFEK